MTEWYLFMKFHNGLKMLDGEQTQIHTMELELRLRLKARKRIRRLYVPTIERTNEKKKLVRYPCMCLCVKAILTW